MTPPAVREPERLALADELLREVVFRSRERTSAVAALRAPVARNANCGLGARAELVLDLSERGREAFVRLFPAGLGDEALEELRAAMGGWIERQDEIDRKRNHFLRDFRARHGLDRRTYAPEVLAEFEAGLARINAEEEAGRDDAARRLVARPI